MRFPQNLLARAQSHSLPDPDVLAQEIVEDIEDALEQFPEIAADLAAKDNQP